MGITTVSSSAQSIWEAEQQEALRNTQKTVSAANGQSVAVVSVDIDDYDGDGVVTMAERARAQRKNAASSGTGTVTTSLENVGPNAYERIRNNAGSAYRAQSVEEDGGGALAGLNKSA